MERIRQPAKPKPSMLNSTRAEKIAAVEGKHLSPRMADILNDADEKRLTGDETRALIKAQFPVKK